MHLPRRPRRSSSPRARRARGADQRPPGAAPAARHQPDQGDRYASRRRLRDRRSAGQQREQNRSLLIRSFYGRRAAGDICSNGGLACTVTSASTRMHCRPAPASASARLRRNLGGTSSDPSRDFGIDPRRFTTRAAHPHRHERLSVSTPRRAPGGAPWTNLKFVHEDSMGKLTFFADYDYKVEPNEDATGFRQPANGGCGGFPPYTARSSSPSRRIASLSHGTPPALGATTAPTTTPPRSARTC